MAGTALTESGVSKPGIYGIALNGKNGTQAINDTDGGELDKDTVYDRAVGGMQFIPSTWQVVQVDADGDSKRDPQDMDDAALATAVYLCSGKDNLSTRQGQEASVFRYNHSQDYVNLVLRLMEAYSSGDYSAVPSGTQGGTSFSPSYSSSIDRTSKVAKERKQREKAAKARARANGTSSGSSSSGSTGGATPGDGSTGSSTPPDSGNAGEGGADGVVTESGNATGATGAGSSDGGDSGTPAPPPPVMSIAEATQKCLADNPLLTGDPLDACIALQRDATDTAPHLADTGAVASP